MESTYPVTSAAVLPVAAPVSDDARCWIRPLRRTLAPAFGPVKGTRMSIVGSLAGPSVAGTAANACERYVVSILPTVEKQQATGAAFGAIPVRTWSPPV